jgi:maleylacetoacetate isomerase
MILYSYWRSLATFRVRIALNLKGIAVDVVEIDLMKGEQRKADFKQVNPQMRVPSLVIDDAPPLFQSLAIIEYLDETKPTPPLLPADPRGRARVRALAMITASDAHPLLVPSVREFLEHEYKLDEAQRAKWGRHWVALGLDAYESHLSRDQATGKFCHGDSVTLADLGLVSHVVAAQYNQLDLKPYPTVRRINDACMAIDAFSRAHPLRQPGAPRAT